MVVNKEMMCFFFFHFLFMGIIVKYLLIIHRIFVAKSWGTSCRKMAMGCFTFRLKFSHSHQSLILRWL